MTYKICVNWLFMLSVLLLVNIGYKQLSFWGINLDVDF